tara:strand:- start:133 stop:456 length:324 start_codon:yes stop_codon:yes gene_type:complete
LNFLKLLNFNFFSSKLDRYKNKKQYIGIYKKDKPDFICGVSDLLNPVLKEIKEIKYKNKKIILFSFDNFKSLFDKIFINNTPVIKNISRALVDLASWDQNGVGKINP